MSQSLSVTIKPTLFHKTKLLSIEPDSIELDYVDKRIGNTVKMTLFDIAELRFGVESINGYRFRIGRKYCIDIKSLSGKIIKVRLTSLYKINKKKLEEKYIIIIQALFENFFNAIVQNYLDEFYQGKSIHLLKTTLTQQGVILNKTKVPIHWHDIDTKRYWSYFTIFSAQDANLYQAYEYKREWNAMVLYYVVTNIAAHKKNPIRS